MTKDEVLKQAREALMEHEGNCWLGKEGVDRHVKAITAIEEALAQSAQEPASSNVGAKWLGDALFDCIKASGIIRKDIGSLSVAELLFFAQDLKGMLERQAATPPAAKPDQEDGCPVCGSDVHDRDALDKAEREIERLTALKVKNT